MALTKSVWSEISIKTDDKLHAIDSGNIFFSQIKNDDSYCKAHAGIPGVYWAFAKDSERAWIELELKARTKGGERHSQTNLYNCIKERIRNSGNEIDDIIWDEDDRKRPRRIDGKDIRIKCFRQSKFTLDNPDKWVNAMVDFIQILNPILHNL